MNASIHGELSCDSSLSPEQQERLAAVLDEYLVSVESGVPLTRESLVAKCPDLEQELLPYLSGLELLQDAAVGFAGGDDDADNHPTANRQCQLGDFELLGEIARGGMGVVYEGRQISLDRQVALKVLPFAAVLDAKQIQRFKNEAQAAAQIHHPHIVPVYAVGQERGVHYYAMQYIDGQPVDQVIRDLRETAKRSSDGRRDSAERTKTSLQTTYDADRGDYYRSVARLGMQAASALHAAHEYGIVHRDIKPSNLLLDANGKAWLTDFGLARCRAGSNLTRTGDLVGTMRYMSPEQASGKSWKVDHRTDIYSLGVTLYELLTLSPAFRGQDGAGLLQNIEQQEPQRPRQASRDLPTDLETIVLRAIAKARSDRYATAEAMADDLERFLNGVPTVARPLSASDRLRRWTRRHTSLVRIASGFAGLAAIGLIVCALLVWRENGAKQLAVEEAETSVELARANYRQARDTVDRLGARVAEKLADMPGAAPLRRSVLEDTLRYYESFVEQSNGDPSLQLDIAVTHTKIAAFAEQIGKTNAAVESYQTAEAMLEQLVEESPHDVSPRSQLALCRNNLALLLARECDVKAAAERLQAAAEIQQQLIREAADNEQFAADLARTQNNLGLVLADCSEEQLASIVPRLSKNSWDNSSTKGPARSNYLAAAETQRELVAGSPDDTDLLRDLAATLNNLAMLEADSANETAIEFAAEARDLHRRLVTASPDMPQLRRELALAENNLGALHARLGQFADATARYEASIEILELLTNEFPAHHRFQSDLGVTYNNLGRVQSKAGDAAAAIASFQRAISIQQNLVELDRSNASYASSLGGIYNNLGIALLNEQRNADAAESFSDAIEHQQRAIKLNPNLGRFRQLLDTHSNNLNRAQNAGA